MEVETGLRGPLLPARFESVRLLGRGGMGSVFLAWDRLLSRHVAIKILASDLATDAVARERFARETALAGQLGTHPHIVTAYEAGEWQQRPYVVFEYMPKGSLAERLQEHGLPPRSLALRWLEQAAAALDHAHAAKIVHRDIKPGNLLLDANDDLSIADFGVYRRDGEATLTAEGEIVGTTGYLAPEQAEGRGATAASDRYALGVVAYQLLTGRLPAAGGAGVAGSPARVFDRALADEPGRRYPTASAFVDALRAALPVDPESTLLRPTRRRLLPLRTTPGARAVAPSPASPRYRQRTRLWRVSVFLLAALVVAAPATAGGLVLGRKLARTQPAHPQARAVPTRCAVSPFEADANLVVSGVGAIRFCRSQAESLSAQGQAWAYRANTHLLAPDSGRPGDLSRVCALARGHLTAAVYDDLGRDIGTDLCHTFAAAGWALRS
ncbi:MAG TPA: serine/threonine-protein kinase [Gaiellaceae bacterium]|nr:serine/threonine-protein kinase [Gaiellaceae bacterium]